MTHHVVCIMRQARQNLSSVIASQHDVLGKNGLSPVFIFISPDPGIKIDGNFIQDEPSTVFCPPWRNNAISYPYVRHLVTTDAKVLFLIDEKWDVSMYGSNPHEYMGYIAHIKEYNGKRAKTVKDWETELSGVSDYLLHWDDYTDMTPELKRDEVIKLGLDHLLIYTAAGFFTKRITAFPGWVIQPGNRWLSALLDQGYARCDNPRSEPPVNVDIPLTQYVEWSEPLIERFAWLDLMESQSYRQRVATITKELLSDEQSPDFSEKMSVALHIESIKK